MRNSCFLKTKTISSDYIFAQDFVLRIKQLFLRMNVKSFFKMRGNNYIKVLQNSVEAILDVYIYTNDGCKIVYSPALDIMGYGNTIKEAKKSFEVVVTDFFESSIKRGTLNDYLLSKKWVKESKDVEFSSPKVVSLVKSNSQLQNILSLSSFTKQTLPYKHSVVYC